MLAFSLHCPSSPTDLRTRPQVGEPDRVHDVPARADLLHLDAALLLPQGAREVRDVPLRILLHVPDPNAGGVAGGHVQDHGTGMMNFYEKTYEQSWFEGRNFTPIDRN